MYQGFPNSIKRYILALEILGDTNNCQRCIGVGVSNSVEDPGLV